VEGRARDEPAGGFLTAKLRLRDHASRRDEEVIDERIVVRRPVLCVANGVRPTDADDGAERGILSDRARGRERPGQERRHQQQAEHGQSYEHPLAVPRMRGQKEKPEARNPARQAQGQPRPAEECSRRAHPFFVASS
jgi:hypothetical protein